MAVREHRSSNKFTTQKGNRKMFGIRETEEGGREREREEVGGKRERIMMSLFYLDNDLLFFDQIFRM